MSFFTDQNRRTIRAEINPLDKSTICSVYPERIEERKIGLMPGLFVIEPGTEANPSILVVGPSSWWKEAGEDQPLIEVTNSSMQMANSIVMDYAIPMIEAHIDRMPGLFWVPGVFDAKDIKVKHKEKFDTAIEKQKAWYMRLITVADSLWARSNGNPLAIDDHMRMAAREMNMLQKEWLKNTQAMDWVRCVACNHMNASTVVVCPNCKVVLNQDKFKELKLQFAS